MISFASLLLVLAGGQGAISQDSTLPGALASRIRAVIGTRWGADSQTIELSWGQLPAAISQMSNAEMRFPAATDRNGWMVVVLTSTNSTTQAIRVRAGQKVRVPASAHALEAGHTLERNDIVLVEETRWGPAVKGTSVEPVGWEVRHTLRAGEILRAPAIAPPLLVRSGEPVMFVWDHGGVHMEYQTTAIGSARLGETVQGRSGNNRITGTVTAPGVARIEERSP